jgi:hypothetical protein
MNPHDNMNPHGHFYGTLEVTKQWFKIQRVRFLTLATTLICETGFEYGRTRA